MKLEYEKKYREDGSVEVEYWHLNGKVHRTDGPALIRFGMNSSVRVKCWFLNGNLHRTDGPAVINYNKNGGIETEHWYLNDKHVIPEKHLMPMPKTEEEKIELINEFVFIKEWLKRDKDFYEKYRVLIE